MCDENKRLTPEEALKIYQKEIKGHFKIFLGYAPGVGKTFAMLSEGNRRLKYGQDVVIGYIETHGRKETEKQIEGLEIIPRKPTTYAKVDMAEMDTDTIILRKPDTVLVDELAHTNVPGSKFKKRYEDVLEILNHGINVVSTVNIQHLESLNDLVSKITGVKVKETIPDHIIDKADEVVVVDLTPEALQNRLKRGNIYELDKIPQSLDNFFRKGNLTALREITLRQIADEVDDDLSEYMKENGIKDNWSVAERIMVCISSSPTSKKLIRRGSRIAKRYRCEWYAVSVNCTSRFAKKSSLKSRQMLNMHQKLASQLGAEIIMLEGKSVSESLAKFAHENHITQIIIGNSQRTSWETFLRGSTINKLLALSKNIDVHVVSTED